jgi:hypothetical protein
VLLKALTLAPSPQTVLLQNVTEFWLIHIGHSQAIFDSLLVAVQVSN